MTIDSIINKNKNELFKGISLEVAFYNYLNQNKAANEVLKENMFNGEIEKIAFSSFKNEVVHKEELEHAIKLVENEQYRKHLTIYHIIGLGIQAEIQQNKNLEDLISQYFLTHSISYKFLIYKAFPKKKQEFISALEAERESQNIKTKILSCIYLGKNLQQEEILEYYEEEDNHFDIPDLILIEEFDKRKVFVYDEEKEKLLDLLLWCAVEIQSKHKIFNNNEDQYNSVFHTMLSKDYKVENQSQRGETLSGKLYGELDVKVFTKNQFPLSIIEGFVIDSIKKDYIRDHLIKLSTTYDPNGLSRNFAIIYAKHNDFNVFWNRYKNFVKTIEFTHDLLSDGIIDKTNNFPKYSSIKIGLSQHQNKGNLVEVYHIFMDVKFE